jgi:hypothetical protein
MPISLPTVQRRPRRHARGDVRPSFESLEERSLPAVTPWPGLFAPVTEAVPAETLDRALELGTLDRTGRAADVGAIGTGPAGAADVAWYRFTLAGPASVTLATRDKVAGSPFVGVLSLYNSDPQDFADPNDPVGYRLLARQDGLEQGGDATLTRDLSPGTYYVAVSGTGNPFFHPLVAGSGYPAASTGEYGLQLTATGLQLGTTPGPVVLTSDPAPGAALDRSPFVLRLNVSAPLDPNTLVPGQTVQLTYNPTGGFGDGNDQDVPLAGVNFSAAADELQLTPVAPLASGYYRLFLAGDQAANAAVVAGLDGSPLGKTDAHPGGADFTITFQVTGIDGGAGSDDTPATARELGHVAGAGLIQLAGAIGDDPAYNPASADPLLANPAAQVDLYHFRLVGTGHFALAAEVFAGRIGSPLDPALSLFERGADGTMQLVGVNDNSLNASPATDGSTPLFNDPVLFAGLTPGDYYLAVSGTGNLPDPSAGIAPVTQGVFDPTVSHSGSNGYTTGPYLLNLLVQPDSVAPQVTATTPADGAQLAAPPTQLVVQFSKPVNLEQLAYQTFQLKSSSEVDAVFVQGADGKKYYPRLVSYDPLSNRATFLMLDGLANGKYQLHLSGSGPLGLADLAGNPLVGNDPSGDHVVHFTVAGAPRGTSGNPLLWLDYEPNNDPAHAQPLGVLFPNELSAGVVIKRAFPPGSGPPGWQGPWQAPRDTADYYAFQILQQREYIISLAGYKPPSGPPVTLTDASGHAIAAIAQGNGSGVKVNLAPGSYVIRVGGWTPAQSAGVAYQLRIGLGLSLENPPPLTSGPAPALRIRLATNTPPPAPAPTPTPAPADPPAVPADPPARLVLAVPPPATPGTGIVAVVATTSTTGTPPAAGLPPGALVGLSAVPVGGVRGDGTPGSAPAPDRLLLPGVGVSFVGGPLRLPVLVQTFSSGSDVTTTGPDQAAPPGGGPPRPRAVLEPRPGHPFAGRLAQGVARLLAGRLDAARAGHAVARRRGQVGRHVPGRPPGRVAAGPGAVGSTRRLRPGLAVGVRRGRTGGLHRRATPAAPPRPDPTPGSPSRPVRFVTSAPGANDRPDDAPKEAWQHEPIHE